MRGRLTNCEGQGLRYGKQAIDDHEFLRRVSAPTCWADAAQREREQELLRVGELYAKAIGNYRASSPGSVKRYPAELGDLLQDNRFVGTRRHLRKLYADPLNPARSWGLIRAPDGGVAGVYAQDERLPFARTGLQVGVVQLAPAQRYSDWKFMPKETP